ncbi:MAG: hypothetical protein AAFU03_17805, partial [Bacteroidota bacterium]
MYLYPVEIFLLLLILICALGVAHTYLIYPYKTIQTDKFYRQEGWEGTYAGAKLEVSSQAGGTLPKVSVLMAVHNEEQVIRQKMESLINQSYSGEYQI